MAVIIQQACLFYQGGVATNGSLAVVSAELSCQEWTCLGAWHPATHKHYLFLYGCAQVAVLYDVFGWSLRFLLQNIRCHTVLNCALTVDRRLLQVPSGFTSIENHHPIHTCMLAHSPRLPSTHTTLVLEPACGEKQPEKQPRVGSRQSLGNAAVTTIVRVVDRKHKLQRLDKQSKRKTKKIEEKEMGKIETEERNTGEENKDDVLMTMVRQRSNETAVQHGQVTK